MKGFDNILWGSGRRALYCVWCDLTNISFSCTWPRTVHRSHIDHAVISSSSKWGKQVKRHRYQEQHQRDRRFIKEWNFEKNGKESMFGSCNLSPRRMLKNFLWLDEKNNLGSSAICDTYTFPCRNYKWYHSFLTIYFSILWLPLWSSKRKEVNFGIESPFKWTRYSLIHSAKR